MSNTVSIFDAKTIEIHYWLQDGSHSMDANVFNRCKYKLFWYYKRSFYSIKSANCS